MPLTPLPKVNPVVLTVLFVPTSAPAVNVPLPVKVKSCPPTVPDIVRSPAAAVVKAS